MNLKLRNILKIIEAESVLDEMDIFREEYLINEGLIKTWPLDKTVSTLLSSKFKVNSKESNNTFEIILNVKNINSLEKSIQLSNNLGWFPSYVRLFSNGREIDRGKFEPENIDQFLTQGFDQIIVTFEAKYDIIQHEIPRFLYHITPRQVAYKVLKFGLSPKTNSVSTTHSDRVFLGKTSNDVKKLLNRLDFAAKSRDGYFWILKINTNLIPSYFRIFNSIDRKNDVFNDPNFLGKGLYTLNAIPPNAIEFEDEINANKIWNK